jgi:hypothetical protein
MVWYDANIVFCEAINIVGGIERLNKYYIGIFTKKVWDGEGWSNSQWPNQTL